MKVFISQPMSGLTEDEVMTVKHNILEMLSSKYGNITTVDNYNHIDVPVDAGSIWHLGTSIQMMEECDAIFFADGWENARGCCVEYEICKYYNLKVLNAELVEYYSGMHNANKTRKQELIEYLIPEPGSVGKNIMGCDENWYNSFYAIRQTFSVEEIEMMSDKEVNDLLKLANEISEALY